METSGAESALQMRREIPIPKVQTPGKPQVPNTLNAVVILSEAKDLWSFGSS